MSSTLWVSASPIDRVYLYNLRHRRRPSFVVHRLISIMSSIFLDNQCKIGMANARQLMSIFHQICFPSGKLLSLCFGCLTHIVCFPILGPSKLDSYRRRKRSSNICLLPSSSPLSSNFGAAPLLTFRAPTLSPPTLHSCAARGKGFDFESAY